MKLLGTLATAALLSMGALTITATSASAAVVCNREGYCWHVKNRYAYKPEFGVVVHEDNWRWGPTEHYTWREHRGRGYWKNGIWIRF